MQLPYTNFAVWMRFSAIATVLAVLLGFTSCKSLSAAEVDLARKSPEALCKAVVGTYRSQDLAAFSQLALSPSQIKQMMSLVNVPESAKRESIKNKSQFVNHVQDSLKTVLRLTDAKWDMAEFQKFVPQRKPIEIATGYKMLLGTLVLKAGDQELSQPFNLMEFPDGSYYIADFGPFVKKE